jgi:ankyrin repeat protein
MLAVKQGKFELVQVMAQAGADKNLADEDGLTALGLAKKLDEADIVKYLRKVGAVE